MSNDWYARRVAQARGAPAPPPQPPAAATAPPSYPQHPAQQQQQYPQQQQAPPQLTEQQMIEMARSGGTPITPMDVLERAGMKGGKGVRTETELCPECGSNQFFQRKGAGKMGMPPAPYCHTCGYNGMYEQYGAIDVPMTPEG